MTILEVLAAVFVMSLAGSSSINAFIQVTQSLGYVQEQRRLMECAEGVAERWMADLPIPELQTVDGVECRCEVVTEVVSGHKLDKVVVHDEKSSLFLWLPGEP